ncbi:MAG: cation-translocating P-type ATPase, partial [Alphaproteobacteria bacterium]
MTEEPCPAVAPWHALAVDDVRARLEVGPHGLDDDEAARRLARVGPNWLPAAARERWPVRLARQFANVLIYVLLAAAAVSVALGHATDALVILAVVVINAVIGFVQEGRAERSLDAIRGLLAPSATVVRGGRRRRIEAEGLVPGDLVVFEPGDRIVADVRLAGARDLALDEAALTGESLPVDKTTDPVAAKTALADRTCLAYAGTLVAAGHGQGLVVATGRTTEIGRIGTLVATIEPMTTPLLRRLARFGRVLTGAILALAAATFAVGVLGHGKDVVAMFMAAVSIAVAAIPEGLPAILTITLAIGVERMARRKAIIRRMPAVEALGSVTVVCTDKTGTLTRNEMAVRAVVVDGQRLAVEGEGYAPVGRVTAPDAGSDAGSRALVEALGRAALLCNDADVHRKDGRWIAVGDPTEAALVTFGGRVGLDARRERGAWPRVDALPFTAETRIMASLHRRTGNGGALVCVKGAPERVLDLCACAATRHGARPLDQDAWHRAADALAAEGHRVLAVASAEPPPGLDRLDAPDALAGLAFIGLVGISDPPREEARGAIARCRAAGIRVKMVTGDHPATAGAIARALGLDMAGGVVAGAALDGLDAAAFADRVVATDVLARTSPEQKLRIVQALQAHGDL